MDGEIGTRRKKTWRRELLFRVASLNSVRIRKELAIELSRAYVYSIIDRGALGPQASVAERLGAPA